MKNIFILHIPTTHIVLLISEQSSSRYKVAVLFWRHSSTASDSMRALCSYLDAALYWVISDTYRSQLHEKKWTFLWGTPHFHHRQIETTTLRKWAWFGWRKRCLWALVDAWGTYYCYDDVIAEVITVFITVFWSALATEMNTILIQFQHNVDVDWLQYWNTLMKDSWLTHRF